MAATMTIAALSERSAEVFSAGERAAWRRRRARLTVSDWADRYRRLPIRGAAEAGQWRTDRVPYMAAVMDAFSDDEVDEITGMFNIQSGKTEAVLNMLGWAIDCEPGPALYSMPRNEDTPYIANERIRPMLEDSPQLAAHITAQKWDLQKQQFYLDTMTLYFTGSNSAAGFQTKSLRYVVLDDVTEYARYATLKFNPVADAEKRLTTYRGLGAKFVKIGPPGEKHEYMWQSWLKSNRQKYWMACPACGLRTVWIPARLKVDPRLTTADDILKHEDVWYECGGCGEKIREDHKAEIVAGGVWLAAGLYKTYVNKTLAEPYEEAVEKRDPAELAKYKGSFSRGTVPAEAMLLTAGADYHEDQKGSVRIDYQVRAFAADGRNWVVTVGAANSFDELDELVLASPWPWADGTANEKKPWLAVGTLFVDSGFKSDKVYEYCLRWPGLTIPTKGADYRQQKVLQVKTVDEAVKRRRGATLRARYRGLQYVLVDTHFFKDMATGWAEPSRDATGRITAGPLTEYYEEIPEYFFTEFTNEHKVRQVVRGRIRHVWVPVTEHAECHALDTSVLCAAAAWFRGATFHRSGRRRMTMPAAMSRAGAAGPPPRRKKEGFLDNLPEL
jgi:phage terminase large subunit GpA-like protein